MLAALTVVLARLNDQDDVVVLSQSAGRNREETQHLIGNFVTTLPLRCYFGSEQSFLDHLDGIRQICLEAWDNEEAPFASLITEVFRDRDLLIDPISPILLVYKNFSIPAVTIGQTTLEVIDLEYQCEPFGLILKVFEETASLSCHFLYNEAAVSHTQARQLAACYACVLRQVADNPHVLLGQCLTTTQLIRTLGLGPVLAHAVKALTKRAGRR
jgi:non-ribosomal peptide synthetase component F